MMRKFTLFLFLALLGACSSWKYFKDTTNVTGSRRGYSLKDMSGKYRVTRDIRFRNKQSQMLSQLIIKETGSNGEIEKTLAYSTVKEKRVTPQRSQYFTWLEKKLFSSQIKYSSQEDAYHVQIKSPEEKWSGLRKVKVPKSRYQCFFSQLPECMMASGIMEKFKKDAEQEIDIVIIWDNYPFYAEQYLGLREELYSIGQLRVDGLQGDKVLRIALEAQNQIIFYTFNEKFEFQNIYWVAQGYRLERDE